MEIKDINTSEFIYNPKSENFISEMEKEPEFRFNPFRIAKLPVLSYICFMYDPASIFLKNEKDYIRRKEIVANLVGLPKTDDAFSQQSIFLMSGKSKEFNNAVIHYCYLSNSIYLQKLAILEYNYEKLLKEALDTYDATKEKLITTVLNGIEEMREKIFGGKEVEMMERALSKKMKSIVKTLRIEGINDKFEEDKLEGFNPYEGYVPDIKIKYEGTEIPKE